MSLLEKGALRAEVAILQRALILCNESRNRLTRFAANPQMWVNEAVAEYRASTKEVVDAQPEAGSTPEPPKAD